jgi:hypothetical protein
MGIHSAHSRVAAVHGSAMAAAGRSAASNVAMSIAAGA